MRIVLAALGTRGDVQPMIALAKGLRAAGHHVTLIAGSNFADWVSGHGLDFVPSVDMEALMASEKGLAWAESSDNPVTELRMMRGLMSEYGQGMIDPIEESARGADLLVSSFSAQPLVQTASEAHGVPYVNALLQPQHPTRSGPASLTPAFPGRASVVNRWVGALTERIVWWIASPTTNAYRRQVGLPPHDGGSYARAIHGAPAVLGFSPLVVPTAPDWPAGAVPTGYWFLDEGEGWSPPPDLAAFLEAGAPPVYFGFGSMSKRNPEGTLALIVAAARRSGRRAVVAAGWSDLAAADLPPEVHVLRSAPHQWLFPRVAAVVHHGGAGTTAAGLRAGKPTLVIPHMSDQPYWGRRVHDLGVGVAPVPRHRLTAETLATRLDELTGCPSIRERAAALGEKIRAERGIERAVAAIEQHALRRDPRAGQVPLPLRRRALRMSNSA